jgi:hypothetical protein
LRRTGRPFQNLFSQKFRETRSSVYQLTRDITLRMAARTSLRLDAVLVRIFASLTAILFGLHLGGKHAVAHVVRALNRLLHAVRFPALGIV